MSAMDLTCQELVDLVTNYLEGALPPAEQRRFEKHIADCTGCRVYLAQMRHTVDLTGRLTSEQLRPEAREALLDLFRDWKKNAP